MSRFKRYSEGFTLIEIVIVLAIAAALIILVFLAISGAQHSKRDHTRKNQAAQLMAALEQYANNNGGSLANMPASGLPSTYLNNIKDPLTGTTPAYDHRASYPDVPYGPWDNVYLVYTSGAVCDPDDGYFQPGNATNYAVLYYTEIGSTGYCLDNQ